MGEHRASNGERDKAEGQSKEAVGGTSPHRLHRCTLEVKAETQADQNSRDDEWQIPLVRERRV